MNARKAISLTIIGGLTCVTMSACYWQSNRYIQSKRRWKSMGTQFKDQKLQELNLSDLPYEDDKTLYDWEYTLVNINGKLDNKNQFVWRFREGQYGYQIINCIKNEQGDGIIINMGWIPQRLKDKYLSPKQAQLSLNQHTGMIKKSEVKDYINQQKKQDLTKLSEHNSYIDLETLSDIYELNNKHKAQIAYIDQFQLDINLQQQDQQDIEDQDDLFPLVQNADNYTTPYLTPNKHLEYATFWSVASLIGVSSFIRILRQF